VLVKVALGVCVELTVIDDEGVPRALAAGDREELSDGVLLCVPVPVLLPVFEALAPCDKDGVGDTEGGGDSDDDGVTVAVSVADTDDVSVADDD
jgi:hypothetical protein